MKYKRVNISIPVYTHKVLRELSESTGKSHSTIFIEAFCEKFGYPAPKGRRRKWYSNIPKEYQERAKHLFEKLRKEYPGIKKSLHIQEVMDKVNLWRQLDEKLNK